MWNWIINFTVTHLGLDIVLSILSHCGSHLHTSTGLYYTPHAGIRQKNTAYTQNSDLQRGIVLYQLALTLFLITRLIILSIRTGSQSMA